MIRRLKPERKVAARIQARNEIEQARDTATRSLADIESSKAGQSSTFQALVEYCKALEARVEALEKVNNIGA